MSYVYTKKNRLGDVIWFIQILALPKASQHGIEYFNEIRKPFSAKSWEIVAREHPEFFHISEGKGKEFSLIARRYQPNLPPLNHGDIQSLIQIAIKIYETQISHSRWWTHFIPIVGAFIGAFSAIYVARFIR
jgi:hypothetical protein